MHVLKRSIVFARENIPKPSAYTQQRVRFSFKSISFEGFERTVCMCIIFSIVAWFTFDPALSDANGSGLAFSDDLSTVSVDGWDHRIALGSVGFSRGIHYWEFTVNKYTADTDPAFGIARIDVARDQMLGML